MSGDDVLIVGLVAIVVAIVACVIADLRASSEGRRRQDPGE